MNRAASDSDVANDGGSVHLKHEKGHTGERSLPAPSDQTPDTFFPLLQTSYWEEGTAQQAQHAQQVQQVQQVQQAVGEEVAQQAQQAVSEEAPCLLRSFLVNMSQLKKNQKTSQKVKFIDDERRESLKEREEALCARARGTERGHSEHFYVSVSFYILI